MHTSSLTDSMIRSRHALVDWDYQMYVKPIACIIHSVQFREWRLNGQAFEFNGALYSVPNPTIALSETKDTKIDVTNGPFASIGIDCDRSNEYADGLFDCLKWFTKALERSRIDTLPPMLHRTTWQASSMRLSQVKGIK